MPLPTGFLAPPSIVVLKADVFDCFDTIVHIEDTIVHIGDTIVHIGDTIVHIVPFSGEHHTCLYETMAHLPPGPECDGAGFGRGGPEGGCALQDGEKVARGAVERGVQGVKAERSLS